MHVVWRTRTPSFGRAAVLQHVSGLGNLAEWDELGAGD
jgi:hypothetical protein